MTLKDISALILVIIIIGLGSVVIKIGLGEFPPLTMATLKFSITSAVLVPFFKSPANIKDTLLLALLFVIEIAFVFYSASKLDAGTAIIVFQLIIPFGAVLAAIFYKEKLGLKGWTAMIVAFIGVAVLTGEPKLKDPLPVFVMALGALAGAGTFIAIKRLTGVNPLAIAAWSSLFAAPLMLLLSIVFEGNFIENINIDGFKGWAALIYNILGDTITACSLWFYLLCKYPINKVAPPTLTVPVIGVFGGVIILGEDMSMHKIIGGIIIITAVAIINYSSKNIKEQTATIKE